MATFLTANASTPKGQMVKPSRISQKKRYDYFRLIEQEGYPRLRAYAEAIDDKIYELTPMEQTNRLEYLKDAWTDYNDIRDMVRAEKAEWNLTQSSAAQKKAMELLNATLDRAVKLASNPEADTKDLTAAVGVLKTVMPALTSVSGNTHVERTSIKTNASKYIN